MFRRGPRNPDRLSVAADARILQYVLRYMSAIFAPSISQSRRSSPCGWMMQQESIHKYRWPNLRVTSIASKNVLGMISGDISSHQLSKLRCESLQSWSFLPQQWLSVM